MWIERCNKCVLNDECRGATAVEYALFIALIAGAIVGVLVALGPQVMTLYDFTF